MLRHTKTAAVLAAACLTIALGGCGVRQPAAKPASEPVKTAADYLKAVQQKEQELKNVDLGFQFNVEFGNEGSSMSMGLTGDVKATGIADSQPVMAMNLSVNMLGMKQDVSMYCADGYQYTNNGTDKVRSVYPADKAFSLPNMGSVAADENSFQELTVTPEGETFVITGKMSEEALSQILDSLGGALGGESSESSAELSQMLDVTEVKLEVTVDKDGNPLTEVCTFTAKIDSSALAGQGGMATAADTVIKVTLEAEYRSFGQPVSITPPADLDAYIDSEVGGLGGLPNMAA